MAFGARFLAFGTTGSTTGASIGEMVIVTVGGDFGRGLLPDSAILPTIGESANVRNNPGLRLAVLARTTISLAPVRTFPKFGGASILTLDPDERGART